MFSLETLIMVGVILFCIGGLVGAIIGRSLIPPQGQRELEERLQACRNELSSYQQDVAQHFADTSQLVNKLTRTYRDVHEHLAQGAMQLTNAEISQKMLQAGEGFSTDKPADAIEPMAFEPPRDWAPKTPGQKGTLSDEFGLHDLPDEPGIESTSVGNRRQPGSDAADAPEPLYKNNKENKHKGNE